KNHLHTGLDAFVSESEGNITNFNEEIEQATQEHTINIKSVIEKGKENRLQLNNQFKTGLTTSFDTVIEDFESGIDTFQDKFSKKLTTIAEKFKKQIDDLKAATAEEIEMLCKEANNSIEKLANKHNQEIAANVDIDNKAVEDNTSTIFEQIEKHDQEAIEAIGNINETLKSSIVLLKANYSADINTKVNDTVQELQNTIKSSNENAKTVYNQSFDTVKENIQKTTENHTTATGEQTTAIKTNMKNKLQIQQDALKDLYTNLKESVSETAQVTKNKAQAVTNSTKQTVGDKVSQIKQDTDTTKETLISGTDEIATKTETALSENVSKLQTQTKNAKQKIESESKRAIDDMAKQSDETLNSMTTEATTNIKKSEETATTNVSKVADVVKTSVKKEIISVRDSLNDFYERFKDDSTRIASLLREFRKQNEAFQTAVIEYPKPLIETALIYSKDAVFARLQDMLTERIKSSVTMVIPDPTDIPINTLEKVKSHAKMTIISKIDEVNNKDIIDNIKSVDHLGRTKIRKIGLQDMIGYSEYIAFDRDGGEEMLIAFRDETENEWVGILSTSDGFKNVVIGETLGRQALSISREIR
ncbi:MAG: hypothetical protein U9O98_07290, partial [Asgard group archaeon]|nr:hypothetical protein [Asgard group archaeon]